MEEEYNDDDSMDDNSIGENDSLQKNIRLEEDSDGEEIPETIFEQEHVESLEKKETNEGMKDVQYEDPFNIYEVLEEKQRNVKDDAHSEESLKYPSGFTPRMDREIDKIS